MSEEAEYDQITVKVPRAVVKFLEALTQFSGIDFEEYLKECIVFKVLADVKDYEGQLWKPQTIIDKYQLEHLA